MIDSCQTHTSQLAPNSALSPKLQASFLKDGKTKNEITWIFDFDLTTAEALLKVSSASLVYQSRLPVSSASLVYQSRLKLVQAMSKENR